MILTDVDDTILAFADHFQEWLERKHGITSAKRLRDHYNIPFTFDMDYDEVTGFVDEFSTSDEMGSLKADNKALQALQELYGRGHRFIAITACTDHPTTLQLRTKNLVDVFGFEWEEIHCVGYGVDKKHFLSKYEPTIWVEDNGQHAITGAEMGFQTFLIDRPYNQTANHPNITRVNDWMEIMNHLGK